MNELLRVLMSGIATKQLVSKIAYLDQATAAKLDQELFLITPVSILMEISGLSVAQCIYKTYPRDKYPRVLVCCGPGNNGGDGIVSAKYLKIMGYSPTILSQAHYRYEHIPALLKQCETFMVAFESLDLIDEVVLAKQYDLLVDAVFGFGFKAPVRSPYNRLLEIMRKSRLPICSIDVPSGWNIDCEGEEEKELLEPETLVSLSAPKICSKKFKGTHYLAGRFLPHELAKKFGLDNSVYTDYEFFVKLH